ncbi:MAG: cytochrome c biogenesis CcdA family protein [Thermoanaerobaculia bacterium]
MTLVLVFAGGLLSSASPCVLAAVPLVVTTVGGTAVSKRRAITLSLAFALGMAICFAALGTIAAITGRLIGDVGRFWPFVLGGVLAVVGLHLAGLVQIPLPTLDGARFRGAGVAGAFTLGALTGTLSSPCATPILVLVLSLVAFEGKIAWGATLMITYSLGHVVLLFLAGVASGFASAYLGSRASIWAQRLHKAFGWVLIGVSALILVPASLTALGLRS